MIKVMTAFFAIFAIIIAAESRVQFLPPNSAINSRMMKFAETDPAAALFGTEQGRLDPNYNPSNSLTQTSSHAINSVQHFTQEETANYDNGEASPSPSSRVHILKPIAVMLILAMIASATTVLIRICSNTKNDPRSTETDRDDPERPPSSDKEISEPQERHSTYQPGHTILNCCNNWNFMISRQSA